MITFNFPRPLGRETVGAHCERGYRRRSLRTAMFLALAVLAALSLKPAVCAPAPPQAAAAGYVVNTFSSTFTSQTVDVGHTFKPGYQWYASRWYYNTPTDAASIALGSDGTIVLDSDGTRAGNNNAQISTFSVPDSGSGSVSGLVGTAFGGGGYFEATLAFDPAAVFKASALLGSSAAGWPSWWGMSAEHLAGMPAGQYWYYYDPSEADHAYAHFAETDFFEYDVATSNNPLAWGGNMADWFGKWTKSAGYSSVQTPWANKLMNVPSGTDFRQFHKYGYLWAPATTNENGYAKYYFDGREVGSQPVTWSQYQGQAPPASSSTPWTQGILDQQHIGLILGSGVNEPMTVKSVNVWQRSANQNIGFGTLYDPLYDLSKAYFQSNMSVDNSSPADFNGDASRAYRLTLSPGVLVYRLSNVASFTARIFAVNGSTATAAFEVSPDYVKWMPVATSSPAVVPTTKGWSYRDLSNRTPIPKGMNYLRITLAGGSESPSDREIGQVRIN
ncbi:MAG: hypothetical protein P4L33_22125 [Capsulimonadaceae bacterium]|nr:hypothetical protein [Capsulimonadaceae bacterium]